jgi:glycosyltransferase involved in cell wall biosynthesis
MASRFRHGNIHIVPHEIDFKVFRPIDKDCARSTLGLRHDRKYVLFAANPEIPVKRFPLAQAAVECLRASDSCIELLVVFKESQDRLALYMNACDALVFPSFQEGSPNIVKQAMACNLPIVATDVGDVTEIIGETKGCYVCNASIEDFVDKLRLVLYSPERTQGHGNVRHLASPVVARRLIGIYESVLRDRTAAIGATVRKTG